MKVILQYTAFLFFITGGILFAEEKDDLYKHNPFSYESVYDKLTHLEIDDGKVAGCRQLTFQRDVATFTLTEGKLYFCKPVGQHVCAAVFSGKGTFSFSPPTQIEKQQLKRFYETDSLVQSFTRLFLLFTDSTYEELSSRLTLSPGKITKDAGAALKLCIKYLGDSKKQEINPELIQPFMDKTRNGLFYAQFYENEAKPLFFEINPYDVEEVRFMRQLKSHVFHYKSEIVSQFHKQEDYRNKIDFDYETKDELGISSQTIDCTVKNNFDLTLRSDLSLLFFKQIKSLCFYLAPKLEVDSIRWGNGSPAYFFKGDESPYLWVQRDTAFAEGEETTLRMYYHGDIIDKKMDYLYIESSISWYPRYDAFAKSTFDLTFHYPSGITLVSVGDSVSSVTEKNITTSRWVSNTPIRNASFNLGYFERLDFVNDTIPPVTVLMTSTHRDIMKEVGEDVVKSAAFYQTIFGKTSLKRLYATEIPYPHGEAFPGLIHLSSGTFRDNSGTWYSAATGESQGFEHIFRAHETAHQWFPIGPDFKTYHDQWLSEGFAHYSALWYYQTVYKDNEKFFKYLDTWRTKIIENNNYLIGDKESGPIWLGYRTRSADTPNDYQLIIYEKGAWVLHMLRTMLVDLQTMNEDRFKTMMQDYYRTFEGKNASTEDFLAIVNKHAGIDMKWFFDQWVYSTALPKYEYAYQSKDTAGQYKVTLHVKQLNVPDTFSAIIPVKVEFGKSKFFRLRVIVSAPEVRLDLPLFPYEPTNLIFNDLEGVLAEVEKVGW